MGLRIMKSRAGMIGGTLTVKNAPEGGAQVACEIAIAGTKHKPDERG